MEQAPGDSESELFRQQLEAAAGDPDAILSTAYAMLGALQQAEKDRDAAFELAVEASSKDTAKADEADQSRLAQQEQTIADLLATTGALRKAANSTNAQATQARERAERLEAENTRLTRQLDRLGSAIEVANAHTCLPDNVKHLVALGTLGLGKTTIYAHSKNRSEVPILTTPERQDPSKVVFTVRMLDANLPDSHGALELR